MCLNLSKELSLRLRRMMPYEMEMMRPFEETSLDFSAKIGGVAYLITLLAGPLAVLVRNKLIVSGDAAATAANVLAHEPLFRLAFSADLIATASYVVVTLVLYKMFKPVSANGSLLAAFFSLVGCSVGAVSCVFHLAPLGLLGNTTFSSVFTAEQLQSLVLLFLRLRLQTYNIGMVFFGFYCLVIGFLSFRSTFIPRFVGVLMACAGLSWLTYLVPPLALSLSPYNLALGFLGEAALTVSLLAIGMSGQRRKERIAAGLPS